ncbi:MAG: dCTP deaminase [Dongiaceae bacterium]
MVLTDREIQLALANGQIEISPSPSEEAYSSTSLDLTLDDPGDIWQELPGQPIRPGKAGYSYQQLNKRKTRVSLKGYTLEPHQFLLAWTRETIRLPAESRIAARVEGKSSIARLGICVHLTAPTIHAGFRGQIQLEMCNFGANEVILDVGMPICQLIFESTLGTPIKGYTGKFASQTSAS